MRLRTNFFSNLLDVARDEIGVEEIQVVDGNRMAELVSNGEIEDAGTLIAYYRYRALSS